jgi:DNA anti-recombination protein RmuC
MPDALSRIAFAAFLAAGPQIAHASLADSAAAPVRLAQANSPKPKDPNAPLTPGQIVSDFRKLPLDTQKQLIKLLMSQSSASEAKMSDSQMDAAFATLSPDAQQSLQAQWNALSDEQRVALKKMNMSAIKEMLGQAFKSEIQDQTQQVLAPVQNIIEKVKSGLKKARAYVQSLLGQSSGAPSGGSPQP